MRRPSTFILIIMLAFIMAGFHRSAAASDKIQAFVSIPPQAYFIKKIGGDAVAVTIMVSAHQSPENFEPLPSQMAALSKADVYFAIGAPFEEVWLKKFTASYPRMRLVHTDDGIIKKPIQREGAYPPEMNDSFSQGHHHDGLDPHVWLSPPLVMIQARHIRDALISIDPSRAPEYNANFNRFMTELTLLDKKIKTIFAATAGKKKFLVFHPSWGYFADAYGLTQLAIEMEGKEPKAKEVAGLIAYAARNNIRTIFVQPQFSAKQAEIIAKELGGRIESIDPLAPDWNDNLLRTAAAINSSFSGK
ncbi:MAG: zinc ABC transporter substrate-binding protein [Desulfobacteraceae bacterium]|nr:zinc ABC transporter substrate-binding protein [Desulfobacteraceae bacterium]